MHADSDLICLSHLRWDSVFQRPHHLMSRFAAQQRRVFFVEEPFFDAEAPRLEVARRGDQLQVLVVHLPADTEPDVAETLQRTLVCDFLDRQEVHSPIMWYYTPMALSWTSDRIAPSCVVYDCMDELSAFKNAPATLRNREYELMQRADLVFAGGRSLYEVKRDQHPSVHCFPSSVDVQHFSRARTERVDPSDQAPIPHPRLGFFGVLDERLDLQLLEAVADARPELQLVMVGPVVKIQDSDLPQRPNIHYLGPKSYAELPIYMSGWDVAILPFARNESTRFISPTKTPEYLAGGLPVVSTSIRDVVSPYGDKGLVQIADTPEHFIAAVERALQQDSNAHTNAADEHLSTMSWDRTWSHMCSLIQDVIADRSQVHQVAGRELVNV